MTSAAEAAALGHAEFWDERYSKANDEKPTHEWFRDFQSLEAFFEKHLLGPRKPESSPKILHLGSGDSTIPYDLLKRGYNNQLCVDFSSVVVDLMKSRHAAHEGVNWSVGDVRDMPSISSKSVDVAFDKGTLDAMIHGSPWSPPDEVMDNTGKYMKEIQRVLKDDGVFLYITYRQPHFVKPILNRNSEWDMQMETLGGGDSFEYYGFVLSKATNP
ncbi:hypothetical protein P280DRAFT_394856 [Massarina eburnea CBS 473.64]|uniref:Methyltransferase domain-containing protein n=1 Tax=Massarina eburnea CBS 473.64 TaxID=1395130 RepID=A0A6A6S5Q4_9PLEO|nr:hypothetical protein P280DRAFT_394856 [Massarina eburnea CBS 473.64]